MARIGRKHVLIIGAGPTQLPAIRAAVSRGFRVTAADMNPNAVGFAEADDVGIVSTKDVEGMVAFAHKVNRQHALDGVMTMASESAITVARIADALGLPGPSVDGAYRATDKVARQEAFAAGGVRSPRFAAARSSDEAITVAEAIGWPVVVKPVDGAGSRGVRKVASPDMMADAVDEIREVSSGEAFLVEEFLTGSEHSIEGVVIDGVTYWTGFSDRNYDRKELHGPYLLENGDTLPTALTCDQEAECRSAADVAVRALGINWGPVKGDIIFTDDGPRVLEMAARLSGDYFCDETVPLHNGIRLVDIVLDLAVGKKIEAVELRPKFRKGVALRYVWPDPGIVSNMRGFDEARAVEGVCAVRLEPRWQDLEVGSRIPRQRSAGERIVSVIATGETAEEAVAAADEAVSRIRIETS